MYSLEDLAADRMSDARIGQGRSFSERVGWHKVRIVDWSDLGQRLQRQTKTERRVSRQHKQTPTSRLPHLAQPSWFRLRRPALQRQHISGWFAGMIVKQAQDARPLARIVDLWIARVDVRRDQALLEHPVGRVLVSGLDIVRRDSNARGNPLCKAL